MTEEKYTDEELLEGDAIQSDKTAPASEEDIEPQVPVISSADQVEAWSVLQLYKRALLLLHSCSIDDENGSEYMNSLYERHFGDKFTQEDVNSGIEDERQQAVITDYIRDRLDYVKTMSTSLNKKKIDKAFENIFSLVGMNINIANSVEDTYDEIFAKRAGQNVFLLEDYEMMKLNRQTWHIYNDKNNITELSGIVTAMEDLSISIDDDKENPDFKIVNDEQLSQFYYNVSEIYEGESNRVNNMTAVNKWHYRAMEYKKKALDLTSRNIIMVANIQNAWNDSSDYNPQKITDACERIISNENATERDKFRAHKLCADTLINLQRVDGFVGRDERIENAVKHYRDALAYVSNKKDRIDLLDSISKAQKFAYNDDFISTRLEIATLLDGRPRIREYAKLADAVKDEKLKINLYKSCINEFHELPDIDIEDRNLYDNIDKKIREILSPDDKKTIRTLDRLKKKYGNDSKKTDTLMFPMMSSKGHDYFNK
ncbi:MAG: hypothetical protein IJ532_04250 [Alphaproteobacteria bacterium]|nr:hypothetical protein [Alphaproteobacteria bacterium]